MSNAAPIFPRHVAYPKVFTALERRELRNGYWVLVNSEGDKPLNVQLQSFVDSSGANITMISSPSVEPLVTEKDKRVYYVSVTIMYVLPEEGAQDDESGRDKVG